MIIDFYQRSPLRYPGGKSRAVKDIMSFIPDDVRTLCSPFLGGGSVEIALANSGVKVMGYDCFEPLVAFWQELLEDPITLSKRIENYLPSLSKTEFLLMRKAMPSRERLDKAICFFVLNRSSFDGDTCNGGMSPKHPRFNQSSVDRVRQFKLTNLTVQPADFRWSIANHPEEFLYLDPPYSSWQRLYGDKGFLQKEFDHQGLAHVLNNRGRWLLSYNDCKVVRELYEGCEFIPLEWKYGMGKEKTSNEVLIRKI